MRHTCQVYVHGPGEEPRQCGEPAVDFVTIAGADHSGDVVEFFTSQIWMCARHWDEQEGS